MSRTSMVAVSTGHSAFARVLVAVFAGACLAFGALAQERENRFGRNLYPANGPSPGSRPECTCRAQGQSFHVGTETCLHINGINQVFRCDMDLNVTSWKPTGSLCPLS